MQPCSGSFDYTHLIDRGCGPEHANTFCARQRLVQQLKVLGPHLRRSRIDARDIASRTPEAADVAPLGRVVVKGDHDDRDRFRGPAGRLDSNLRPHHDDHVDITPYHLLRSARDIDAQMEVDRQVAAVYPAQFVQPMLERDIERCGAGIGTTEDNGDPWDAGSELRTRL